MWVRRFDDSLELGIRVSERDFAFCSGKNTVYFENILLNSKTSVMSAESGIQRSFLKKLLLTRNIERNQPKPPTAPAPGMALVFRNTESSLVVTAARFFCRGSHWLPLTVCRSVMHCQALCSQAFHLQVQCVLVIVSGDGQLALHRVGIVCVTSISIDSTNPLQPFPGAWQTQLI